MDDWGDTVLEFKSLPTFIRTVLRRLSDPEFITGFWRKDFFSPVFFIRSVLRHLKNFYPDADEAFIGIYNSGAKHTVTGYHKDAGLPPPDYRWRGLMKFQKKFPIYSGHIIREKFVRIGLQKQQDIFFQQSIFSYPILSFWDVNENGILSSTSHQVEQALTDLSFEVNFNAGIFLRTSSVNWHWTFSVFAGFCWLSGFRKHKNQQTSIQYPVMKAIWGVRFLEELLRFLGVCDGFSGFHDLKKFRCQFSDARNQQSKLYKLHCHSVVMLCYHIKMNLHLMR